MRGARFSAGLRLCILLLGVVAAAALAAPAQAATIQVNNPVPGTGGTGDCTLQEAIQAANTDTAVDGCAAGSGADIILFCNCTLTLTAPFLVDPTDGPIGLPDITTDVTIQGLSPALSVLQRLDPGPDFSIFRVATGGVLRLERIRLRKGRNMTGGAIINRGMVVVRFSELNDNQATGPAGAGGGGAITNFPPGTLTIDGSTLDNNSATAGPGGAIRNESTLDIVSSTFSSNTAGTIGGAIDTFFGGAPVTIDFSVFFDNTAVAFGGAVHHHVSPLTVTNSSFFSNTAGSFSVMQAGGGAIEGFGPWVISDSVFDGNLAFSFNVADGGALRYIGDSLMVSKCTFSNNIAQTGGGGIEINGVPSPNIRVVNSTFSGNQANGTGGGGIDVLTGSMELNNVTIAANRGTRGAGVRVAAGAASFISRNSIIGANTAESNEEDCLTESPAVLTSQGHNLISVTDGCTIVATGPGDLLGTAAAPLDPMLVPLQNNGGLTMTHALRPGSPAVDAGDLGAPGTGGTTCEAADQRGTGRPVGAACDIGAFEGTLAQADLGITLMDNPDPVAFGQTVTFTITVTNNGPDTAPGVLATQGLTLGFDAVSAMSTQGTCTINQPSSGDEVSCDIGSVSSGAVVTITVMATAIQSGLQLTFGQVFSGMVDDPNPSNNDLTFPSIATYVTRDGDLSLAKLGSASVVRNTNFSYILTVENRSSTDATSVTVTDMLPAGVTFVSAIPAICTPAGGTVTCNVGLLGSRATQTTFMTVTAPATTGNVMNTATAAGAETDPDSANNTATATTLVRGTATLVVAKTDSPDPVAAGSNVTYTITVMNNGPDPATNVALFETTPFGATFVSINTAQGSCTAGPNPVCTIGTINNGASVMVTFVVRADVPCVLDNTAFVTSPDAPPASASATTTVGPAAPDLEVTMTDAPDPVTMGQTLIYTVTLAVLNSPGTFSPVVITDVLPAGVTFDPSLSTNICSEAGGTVTCNVGGVSSGSIASITIAVTVNAPGTITNTVTAVPTPADTNPANNTATVMTTAVAGACVTFDNGSGDGLWTTATNWSGNMVPGPADCVVIPAGQTVTLTMGMQVIGSLQNDGTLNITGGTLDIAQASTSSGTFNLNGGTLTGTGDLNVASPLIWSGGTMSGTGTTTSSGVFTLNGGTKTLARTLNNMGVATWSAGQIDAANATIINGAAATFSIQGDLLLNSAGGASQFNNAGMLFKTMGTGMANIEAGVAFNNTGSVSVTSGTLVLRGGGSCGGACNGAWSVGPGSALTFDANTFNLSGSISGAGIVNFNGSAGNGIVNHSGTYNVTGGTILNGGTANFTGSVTSTGPVTSTSSNLSFTGSATGVGATTMVGGNATFSNTEGTLTFPSLSILGVVDGTSDLNIIGAFDYRGSSVIQTTGTITIGGFFTWTFGQIRNGDTVTALGGMLMNPVSTTNLVLTNRTLENAGSAVWTVTPPSFIVMGNAVFVNRAGASFDIQTGADFFLSAGAATINNLGTFMKSAGGGSTDIFAGITFNNSGAVIAGNGTLNFQGPFTQTAGSTTLNGGNIATASPLAINGGTLGGAGTITGGVNVSGTGQVAPGLTPGILTVSGAYTQAATSSLNIEIGGLTVGTQHDQLAVVGPATLDGTLNVTLISGFTPAGGNTFTILTAATRTGTFATTNLPPLAGGLTWNVQYNASSVVLQVVSGLSADLALTKTDSPDPVLVGGTVTYTITVFNAGPDPASNVMLMDTLPTGVAPGTITPSQGACMVGTGTITCDLGVIDVLAQATITIDIVPSAAAVPMITNTVSVTAAEADPSTANNMAMESTTVNPVADVSLAKGDAPDPVAATTNLTYTLTVMNLGPSTATGIVVTDTLPAGVNFVSASAGCAAAGGTVTCNIASLASGANAVLSIVVTPQAAVVGTMITNTATVTANEADPNANNNSAVADTTVVAAMADVQLTKADAPDPVIINATLTYTLTVRNNGPQSATNVVLADTLPAGVAFGTATTPCTQAMGIVTCNLGTLASGAQTVITITVTPGAALGGTSITNNASVTAAEPDPNAGNNMASATTAVSTVPFTLSVPSPTMATIPSGAPATFTFNVTPTVPGIAVAISCGLVLPPDTTCTVVPPSIVFSNTNPQPVTVTLQTTICLLTVPPRYGPRFPEGDPRLIWPLLLALSLLFWTKVARRNDQLKRWTPVFALLVFALLLGACASGSAGPSVRRNGPIGTLPGTYMIPITVTSGSSSQTVTFTLTVNL